MPSPLPPLKVNPPARLSFLRGPKSPATPDPGGRPTIHWIVQLEADFDPINGTGQWRYIKFPQDVDFDDWEEFERFCRQHLPVPREQFDYLMDYLHNFKTLNIDLRNGEVYPVIPRPIGYTAVPMLAGAPGTYLGGGGEGGGKG